jgi:6-pyruvoyltetrahydropterin/6-carboxytetrahydropterin synthase
MFEIMIEDTFASAHQLVGYEGPCENMHGHTWKVQVFFRGNKLNKLGMLFDFKEAKKILKDILAEFDHKNLNGLPYFKKENPTAENIAKIIHGKIGQIKTAADLTRTTVWESEATCATYHS